MSIFLFSMLRDNSLVCSLFFTGTLTRLADLKFFVWETDVLVNFHYVPLTPTLRWKNAVSYGQAAEMYTRPSNACVQFGILGALG